MLSWQCVSHLLSMASLQRIQREPGHERQNAAIARREARRDRSADRDTLGDPSRCDGIAGVAESGAPGGELEQLLLHFERGGFAIHRQSGWKSATVAEEGSARGTVEVCQPQRNGSHCLLGSGGRRGERSRARGRDERTRRHAATDVV